MRRMILSTAVGALVILGAAPAHAVTWFSASDPLEAIAGGAIQAQGYGDFHNSADFYARNNSWQRDPNPGGDSVYVETDYYFYYSGAYQYDSSRQTARSNSSTYVLKYTQRALHASGTRARGIINVLEDNPFGGDPSSPNCIKTFYY